MGSLHFRMRTITDRQMPRGRANSVLSLEKNKVKYNTTQIASLLAVATVFVGLWTLDIYILLLAGGGGGVGITHETKLPMLELELRMQGGLCARGGAKSQDSTIHVSSPAHIIYYAPSIRNSFQFYIKYL